MISNYYISDIPLVAEITVIKQLFGAPHFASLIEAGWRIYASVQHDNIASDNGLSPGRRQAIIWSNAVILLIGPIGTNFSNGNLYIFIQENALANVVWKNGDHNVLASMC